MLKKEISKYINQGEKIKASITNITKERAEKNGIHMTEKTVQEEAEVISKKEVQAEVTGANQKMN